MDKIKSWLEPLLKEKGCRLYELEWDTSMKPPVLRISIENENGNTDLDLCAACSDLISAKLDETNDIDAEYMLEVCSPGAEKELRNDEEIARAKGEYVYIKLKQGQEGLHELRGDLKEVNDDSIQVAYFLKGRPKKMNIAKDNIALIMTTVKV